MNKRWVNLTRVLISAGALAFLLWKVEWRGILAELGRLDLRYLALGFSLFILGLVVRAYRWFILVRALDARVSFARLLRLYFAGQFFSAFLPSAYGGDVVRALELTQDAQAAAAVGTVLVDRMTGLMMLALMGLAALPFQAERMERWLIGVMAAVTAGILAGGALILEGRLLRALTARLPFGLSLAGQGPLGKVYAAVTGCGWRATLTACVVSLVFNGINIVIHWLCGQAVGAGIGLGYFFAVTPLISVAGLVPSVGGWGIREGVSAAVFTSVSDEKAAALGASVGLVALAAGLVGGAVYGIESLLNLRARPGEG